MSTDIDNRGRGRCAYLWDVQIACDVELGKTFKRNLLDCVGALSSFPVIRTLSGVRAGQGKSPSMSRISSRRVARTFSQTSRDAISAEAFFVIVSATRCRYSVTCR